MALGKKHNARGMTDGTIAKALVKAHGFLAPAARFLDISRNTLKKRIEASEDLREILHDLIEGTLDEIENVAWERAKAGDWEACRFVLRTKGRHRGYGDTIEHSGQVNLKTYIVVDPEKDV